MYHCTACKVPALVVLGHVVRQCSCAAPLAAEMTAKVEASARLR